jgi:hypothetical protein
MDTRPLAVGRVADAVGHCVLIFAFLPAIAALPAWLSFELRNPLNASDPVVLTFLPVRGAILLLHAFRAGVLQGVLAGMLYGLFVCAWARRWGEVTPAGRRWAYGALGGALAAAVVVGGFLALGAVRGPIASVALASVAFEIGSGAVCGLVAARRALRLAAGTGAPRA